MISLFDFSRQIADFKKEKKYAQALSFFKENKISFSKEQLSQNEYIVSDIITCLRFTNQYDAGFKFLNIYDINIDISQKERVLTVYGWLLWSKYKAENENTSNIEEDHCFSDEDEEVYPIGGFNYIKNEIIVRIENLISILMLLESDFSKTLITNLFLIVLKTEKKKAAPNWKLINDFCDKIDPKKLSNDCSTIKVKRKGQIRDMELASNHENWYAYKTKSLMKLGKWQDCFDLSKDALENIDNFHYSNDVWFSRRVALSKKNLGNAEETIEELEAILKRKREWFIQKELAELYFEKDDLDAAFEMAVNAVNNFGLLEFKVDLLYLLGKILKSQKHVDIAFKHFLLSKLIRQDEEWKVPQKLIDELNQFKEVDLSLSNLNDLKNELKRYWNEFSLSLDRKKNFKEKSETTKHQGEVLKILHDNERGKDGFIKYYDKDYYFSVSLNYHLTSDIAAGCNVIFKILPAKDGKKDQVRILKLVK